MQDIIVRRILIDQVPIIRTPVMHFCYCSVDIKDICRWQFIFIFGCDKMLQRKLFSELNIHTLHDMERYTFPTLSLVILRQAIFIKHLVKDYIFDVNTLFLEDRFETIASLWIQVCI